MPPEILAHFKSRDTGDDKVTDKEKRKAALEKALIVTGKQFYY